MGQVAPDILKAQKHQQLVWYKYKNDIILIRAHGKVN